MRRQNAKGVFERQTMEARFWERVDRRGPDECWLWLGKPDPKTGYARITDYWDKFYVHRYSYELAYAPIPAGRWIQVCHSCDVKLCVNPRHLWLGTARANNDEKIARGRARYGTAPQRKGMANPRAKLTDATVREIRRRYATEAVTYRQLGTEYGVNFSMVHKIVRRLAWAHID